MNKIVRPVLAALSANGLRLQLKYRAISRVPALDK